MDHRVLTNRREVWKIVTIDHLFKTIKSIRSDLGWAEVRRVAPTTYVYSDLLWSSAIMWSVMDCIRTHRAKIGAGGTVDADQSNGNTSTDYNDSQGTIQS